MNDNPSHNPLTSLSLLQRLQRAPSDADWTRLVQLYAPLIEQWFRDAGLSREDAEDLSQQLYLRVINHLQYFQRRREFAFRGWLKTIVRNLAMDHLRQRQRESLTLNGYVELARSQHTTAELKEIEQREMLILVERAQELVRDGFSPTTWRCFDLVVNLGRSPSDVARELNLQPNAVRQAVHRVRRRLIDEFGELTQ